MVLRRCKGLSKEIHAAETGADNFSSSSSGWLKLRGTTDISLCVTKTEVASLDGVASLGTGRPPASFGNYLASIIHGTGQPW